MKVTVYFKGLGCRVAKMEGRLVEVDEEKGTVDFVRKRCRNVTSLWTYYNPWILVVEGWGHPDPESGMEKVSESDGVSVSRSRYRSCDPRIVGDFKTANFFGERVVAEIGRA